jgi:hypothetical protein
MHLLEELDGRLVHLPALPWWQSKYNCRIALDFFVIVMESKAGQ